MSKPASLWELYEEVQFMNMSLRRIWKPRGEYTTTQGRIRYFRKACRAPGNAAYYEAVQSIAELKGPYTHLGARLAEKAKYRHEVGTGMASVPE